MPRDPRDPLLLLAIGALLKPVLEKGVPRAWSWFRTRGPALPGERIEILRDFLLTEGRYHLHPASSYRPAEGQPPPPADSLGYPHDFEALKAFLHLAPGHLEVLPHALYSAEVAASDHVIAAGSPKANGMAKQYLPSYAIRKDSEGLEFETAVEPDDVRYWYVENHVQPRVEVISKMRGGVSDPKTRKAIRVGGAAPVIWQPDGYLARLPNREAAKLTRDFLLVSRLPRNMAGASIVVAGGGHGAGTEATRLLFDHLPISELRSLHGVLRGKPYWQFVVEVTKVEHQSDGTMPRKIKISTDLPPVILTPKVRA